MSNEMALDDVYKRLSTLVSIDKHALDEEMVQLPSIYQEVCEATAEAYELYENAKSSLNGLAIDIAAAIRKESEEKISDTKLATLVPGDPEYIEAAQGVAAAKKRYDKLSSLRGSLEQKSRSLKNLVALHLAGYWASPNAPKEEEAVRSQVRASRTAPAAEVSETRTGRAARSEDVQDDAPAEEAADSSQSRSRRRTETEEVAADTAEKEVAESPRTRGLRRGAASADEAPVAESESASGGSLRSRRLARTSASEEKAPEAAPPRTRGLRRGAASAEEPEQETRKDEPESSEEAAPRTRGLRRHRT